jgi:hypothetical protein
VTGSVHGLGMVQTVAVDPMERRMETALRMAEKTGDHLWIAAVVHGLSDKAAKEISTTPDGGTPETIMDAETIMGIEFGCYRCEKPLEARLVGRRCPGEPRDSREH